MSKGALGTKQADRIWELDALRGFCILCVIVVHTLFDLVYFAGIGLELPHWYVLIQQYGGAIFVVLSGCCITLGSRSVRRGLTVFACGMLISAVTAGMYFLGMADRDVIVWFGVLHLLGVCMLLYPLFRHQPTAAVLAEAMVILTAGYLFVNVTVKTPFLFPLGLVTKEFVSSDFFPLFPQLGWFLLGVCLGRTLYREKKTLLPGTFGQCAPVRFFRFCGRHSLLIYLLHQPIVFGILTLLIR